MKRSISSWLDHRAGGIIRIRNEELPGARRSPRRQHGFEVVRVIRIGNLDGLRPEELGHERYSTAKA